MFEVYEGRFSEVLKMEARKKAKKEVLSYDKLLEERDNQDKLFKIPIKKNI